jgi:hypothetical protein
MEHDPIQLAQLTVYQKYKITKRPRYAFAITCFSIAAAMLPIILLVSLGNANYITKFTLFGTASLFYSIGAYYNREHVLGFRQYQFIVFSAVIGIALLTVKWWL